MKKLVLTGIVALFMTSSAFAAKPQTCTSDLNQDGGFLSLHIVERGTHALISGYLNGGESKIAESFGPVTAFASSKGDSTKYTWKAEGSWGAGSVTVTQGVATADYGVWKDAGNYDCK